MRRVLLLIGLLVCIINAKAQNKEAIINAYRSGVLTNGQIEQLRKEYMGVVSSPKKNDVQPSRRRGLLSEEESDTTIQDAWRRSVPKVDGHAKTSDIYGHSLFYGGYGSFTPNINIATPENYLLGAGDEIIIDLWGDVQCDYRLEISPDGRVVIDDVGPVVLAGLTIDEAERRLRHALSTIYEGLSTGEVDMLLTLGAIRTIRVNVAGEVVMPGSYSLHSLSTLMHAIYVAGGVTEIGSLRNVKLYRASQQIATADIYDYLQGNDKSVNISLRDGDLVVVPSYENLVMVEGKVRRPMAYEIVKGERLADVIRLAGGFAEGADTDRVMVMRRTDAKHRYHTLNADEQAEFVLADGDRINIGGDINRYENRVEVRGAVNREGYYAINDSTRTLLDLIRRADGLREDAFMARALLYREGEELLPELYSISLQELLLGEIQDVMLHPNDKLVVYAIEDMHEDYKVSIFGAVGRAGEYPYAENMTVEDLIVAAGGLLESASEINLIVARRIKSPRSKGAHEQLFELFTLDVSGHLKPENDEFVLQPFDEVFVRHSPVYITQSSVEVRGEVAFEGRYPLIRRNMRLSELITQAGNLTPGAFVEGAYLLRQMTDEESRQYNILNSLLENQTLATRVDSLRLSGLDTLAIYPVGIDLVAALKMPNSDADVVVRDGDVIVIPPYNGTVRVMGSVLYPNSVTYRQGQRLRHYIKAAGGFCQRARRRGTFVVYMNGMVSAGLSSKVRPGSIVVVPYKAPMTPFRWNDIFRLLSSSASTAAVVSR